MAEPTVSEQQREHDRVEEPTPLHRDVRAQQKRDVVAVIGCIRIFSAVVISTFFQPDEFYQSLEPAWQLVYGKDSGAWITWVSRNFGEVQHVIRCERCTTFQMRLSRTLCADGGDVGMGSSAAVIAAPYRHHARLPGCFVFELDRWIATQSARYHAYLESPTHACWLFGSH